jgi:hypothetical protein
MDFVKFIRQLFFGLDKIIYLFVGYIYDFLLDLAQMRIFTNESFSDLSRRIYTLIGILILFKIAFTLVSIVANPDKALDSKSGSANSLVPRVIITLVLLILIPSIFNVAYYVQSVILGQNVIPRIITGIVNSGKSEIKSINQVCVFQIAEQNYQFYDNACDMNPVTDYSAGKDVYTCPIPLSGLSGGKVLDMGLEPSRTPYTVYIPSSYLVVDLGKSSNNVFYYASNPSSQLTDNPTLEYNRLATGISVNRIKDIAGGYTCKPFEPKSGIVNLNFVSGKSANISFTQSDVPGGTLSLTEIFKSKSSSYLLTTGREFASSILFGFVTYSDNNDIDINAPTTQTYITQYKAAMANADYNSLETLVTVKGDNNKFIFIYYYLISTAVGVFVLLLLVSSCFDIALRSIVLGFLQIIAPIPVSSYIEYGNTSGKTFSSYVNFTLTTYLDVFIRILCISFSTYAIGKVTAGGEMNFAADTGLYGKLLNLFIIMGALMFIKQAPSIIGKIFGLKDLGAGMFNLNPLRKLAEVPLAGSAIGGAIGSVTGSVSGGKAGGYAFGPLGAVGGALLGALYGAAKGIGGTPLGGIEKNKGKVPNFLEIGRKSAAAGAYWPRFYAYEKYDSASQNPLKRDWKGAADKLANAERTHDEHTRIKLNEIPTIESNLRAANVDLSKYNQQLRDLTDRRNSIMSTSGDVDLQQLSEINVEMDKVGTQITATQSNITSLNTRKEQLNRNVDEAWLDLVGRKDEQGHTIEKGARKEESDAKKRYQEQGAKIFGLETEKHKARRTTAEGINSKK